MTKDMLTSINAKIACEPDVGLWFKNGKLTAVFEAKKQESGGNAIERWLKNFLLSSSLNKQVRYVTFGIREGFLEGGYCYNFACSMMSVERHIMAPTNNIHKVVNKLYFEGQSWFPSPTGFDPAYIEQIMTNAILGDIIE